MDTTSSKSYVVLHGPLISVGFGIIAHVYVGVHGLLVLSLFRFLDFFGTMMESDLNKCDSS